VTEEHDTADSETSEPPGGTGRVDAVQLVPSNSSAIAITPPPSDGELAPVEA
jgi:hypothetical protein